MLVPGPTAHSPTPPNPVQRAVGAALVAGMGAAERLFPGPDVVGRPLATAPRDADPVLLVPGAPDGGASFAQWERSFARDGVRVHRMAMPGQGMGDVMTSARHLAEEVARVREETGARKVDLVGYSQGGLVARAFVELLGGAGAVDALVTVATPNNGNSALAPVLSSRLARRLLPQGVTDQVVGSRLLSRLGAGGGPPAGVRYTSIHVDGFDGVVLPASSPRLPGADNVALPRRGTSPNHVSILRSSDAAYEAARSAVLASSAVAA